MKDLGHLLGRPTWRAFVVDGIGIALSPGELCRWSSTTSNVGGR